ncbi:MAG: hypothetical protein HY235_24130 [Acidobacteria bacterium]|nr:hypothetical protein [Acidobacteriota bacterium]
MLRNDPESYREVSLRTTRSVETATPAVRGRVRLKLKMDLTGLAASGQYPVAVVDADGRSIWQGTATPAGGEAVVTMAQALQPGDYWVRLMTTPPGRRLLREYLLQVEPSR